MIEITIKGALLAPKWETLQEVLQQMTKTTGKLTRIARLDNGVNYQAPGEYALTFLTPEEAVEIKLNVS